MRRAYTYHDPCCFHSLKTQRTVFFSASTGTFWATRNFYQPYTTLERTSYGVPGTQDQIIALLANANFIWNILLLAQRCGMKFGTGIPL